MTAKPKSLKEVVDGVRLAWPELVRQLAQDMVEWDEGDIFHPDLVRRRHELVILAGASPNAAILQAWALLEQSLRGAAGRHGLSSTLTAHQILQRLPARACLLNSVKEHIDRLRKTRNQIAHSDVETSSSEAAEFAQVAVQIAEHVDFITDERNDHDFAPGWRERFGAG